METLRSEVEAEQYRIQYNVNCKDSRKLLSEDLLRLRLDIDNLIYMKNSENRKTLYQQARRTYFNIRRNGDNYFGVGLPNPVQPQEDALLLSQKRVGNNLEAGYEGLDTLDMLSLQFNNEVIDGMQQILTLPMIVSDVLNQINEELQKSVQKEYMYLKHLYKCFDPPSSLFEIEQKYKSAMINYRIAREKELTQATIPLQKTIKFFEASINKQYFDENRDQYQQVLEKEKELYKEIFLSKVRDNDLDVQKSLRKTYEIIGGDIVTISEGQQVIYAGNSKFKVEVLNKNFELLTAIDIPEQEFRNCLEVENQFLLLSTHLGNALHKYSIQNYELIESHQFSDCINDIVWLKESFVALSSEKGELVLFDYLQFAMVNKFDLNIGQLWKSKKCFEDESLLLVCGTKGIAAAKINSSNQFEFTNENYQNNEMITDILQLCPFKYAICYNGWNAKLIGIIDRKTRIVNDIENPKGEDHTNTIDRVNGLNDFYIIQTFNDLFLFNYTTEQVTHIIRNYYPAYSISNIVGCYNENDHCLKVYAIEERFKRYDILEIRIQ